MRAQCKDSPLESRLGSKIVLGCSNAWAVVCYVGKGNEKKNLGAFGATICMAGSY